MRRLDPVLAEGTVDEVLAQGGNSPAHTWPESRHPGNQWLANLKGQRAHERAVAQAGVQARLFVRSEFVRAGYPLPPLLDRTLP